MVLNSDLNPYRPWNYYSKPRYYTTYVPTCLVSDRYHNPYRFYRPMHIAPAQRVNIDAYLPYIPSADYDYSSNSSLDTTTPISAMLSPFNPESVRYDYAYGTEFASATQDIRAAADKLLQDVQSASTRPRRAVVEPDYSSDLDLNATRRITSRGRLTSAEPLTRRIIAARYN